MGSPRRTRSMTRSMQGIDSDTSLAKSSQSLFKSSAPSKKKRTSSDQSVGPLIRAYMNEEGSAACPPGSDLGPSGRAEGASGSTAGPPGSIAGPSGSMAGPSGSMSVSSVRGSDFRGNKGKNTPGETANMHDLESRANNLRSPPVTEIVMANEPSNRQRVQPAKSKGKIPTTRLQKKIDQTREESGGGSSGEPRDAGRRGGSKVKNYLIGNIKNICESNEESVDSSGDES